MCWPARLKEIAFEGEVHGDSTHNEAGGVRKERGVGEGEV